jgi:hypothetical protein
MIRENLDRNELLANAACGYPAESVTLRGARPTGRFTVRYADRQRDDLGEYIPLTAELLHALDSSVASTRMPEQDRLELIAAVAAVREPRVNGNGRV